MYQANIPQPTDQLSQSQQDILGNFQALAPLVLGVNNYILLPEQVASPATAAGQMALYTKDDGTRPALFLRNESNGTEVNFTTALKATTGWTKLPSGLIIQWGVQTINPFAAGAYIINLTPGIFTTCLFTMATTNYANGLDQNTFAAPNRSVMNPNTIGIYLTLRNNALPGPASPVQVVWQAIGV